METTPKTPRAKTWSHKFVEPHGSNNDREFRVAQDVLLDDAPHDALSHFLGEPDEKEPQSSSKAVDNLTPGKDMVGNENYNAPFRACDLEKRWENWSYVPRENRPHALLPGRTASPPSPSSISRARRYAQNLGWRILLAIRYTTSEKYAVPDDSVLRNTRLYLSLTEIACQMNCVHLAQAYEACRIIGHEEECKMMNARGPPLGFESMRNPSTTVFVVMCLAYSLFSWSQFSFNKVDRFQRHFLVVGLVVGFFMSLPIVDVSDVGFVASRFGTYLTAALTASACGHWVWWMCFGKRSEEKVESDGEKEMRSVEGV